jgi:excisionase family DNA binding protein
MLIKLAKPASKLQPMEPAGPKASGTKTTPLNMPGTKVPTGQKKKPSKPISPDAEFLDVGQVASRWNVSTRHVHRMIANGELKVVRFGRAVRIPLSAVLLWEVSQRR